MKDVPEDVADFPGKCARQRCGSRGLKTFGEGWRCDMNGTPKGIADVPGICVEA